MKPDRKCLLLAEKIREILRHGLTPGSDVLHYVDSTFSNPSLRELEEILTDASDGENEALLELIFFPDESIQVRLEDILESGNFQKQDEDKVVDALLSLAPLETILRFSQDRGTLRLSMPDWIAEPFISRLNISRRLDQRLVDAITHHVPEECGTLFKVKLRNTRFALGENKVCFVCRFFEQMRIKLQDISEYLDFVLNFFDELQDDRNIHQSLTDKRRFYLENVQKAVKFQEQLKKSNMETLMLRGVRVPHINKDNALKKIVMIDDICLALFG